MTEIDTLKADLAEARELLEHFHFIAHGPGCVCAMCEQRQAFLNRTKPKSHGRNIRRAEMTDKQIKHMVDRFLGWRLPEHFRPDAGISFNPEYNVEFNAARGKPPARHQPSGTNLFDAEQAAIMVRYMIEGMP